MPEQESATSPQEHPILKRTPLPKLQLFIAFLIQAAEPVAASVIHPFVNQFVRDTGVTGGDERKTGYYAGAVGSVFFFAEAFTVFFWGRASDWLGRRPILLLGPIGLACAMLCFGLSTKYWQLIVSRIIQGVFNGNIGVSKTVIAEITDSTNIADAYAMLPLTWSLGVTLGPILGGLLAEPAKTWPGLFGRYPFFHDKPYFLPCAAAGSFALLGGAVAFIGLKETLPSAVAKQKRQKLAEDTIEADSSRPGSNPTTPLLIDDTPSYGSTSPGEHDMTADTQSKRIPQEDADEPPPISALLVRQVLLPLFVYMVLAFVDMSSQVLLPLMYSTSIPLGGLGLDPYHIGLILSAFGFVNAFVQLFFLPRLVRRFGPRNVCAAAQVSYVGNMSLYPLLSFFARRVGRLDGKAWAVVVAQLAFRLTNGMAWGSIQMIIVDSAPSRAALGATNGLAQAAGCFSRGIGPSVAASLFSISLERNLLGGNMVYIVLMGCALFGLQLSFLLPRRLKSQN